MKTIMMVIYAINVLLLISQIATGESVVHKLDRKDIQSKVYDSFEPWLVVFYGAEDNLDQFLEVVSMKLSTYGISVGMIDCSKNMRLCQAENLRSLPSVHMISERPTVNPYSRKMYRASELYAGESLNMKSLESFVAKSFPSSILSKVKTIEEFDSSVEMGLEVPTVVIFSEKSTISLMYRIIARRFKGDLNFVHVHIKSSMDLSDKYDVSSTAIGIIKNQSGILIPFEGEDLTSTVDIVTWLSTFVSEKPPSVGTTAASDPSADSTINDQKAEMNMNHYLSKDFDINTLSTDNAWMVAVGVQKGNMPSIWSDATKGCMGHIQSAVIFCDNESDENANKENNTNKNEIPIDGDSSVDKTELSFGQQVCKKIKNIPSILIIEYGATERKKIGNSKFKLESIIMDMASHEKAFKILGESLPTSSVSTIFESILPQYVDEGLSKGLLSFILVSSSTEVSSLFANIALTYNNIAQFGFISNPSQNMMQQSNIMKLPTIIALTPQTPEEIASHPNEGAGMRVTLYDYQAFGPIRFSSLGFFVEGVVRQINLKK